MHACSKIVGNNVRRNPFRFAVRSVFQLTEGPPDEDDACEGEACSFREWTLPSMNFHRVRKWLMHGRMQADVFQTKRTFSQPACVAHLCGMSANCGSGCMQLWQNLIYDTAVKSRLLQYSESALTFSDHKVRTRISEHATMRSHV